MFDDVDLHIYGANFLMRANKCFEKAAFFSNLPTHAKRTGRAPKWALENAGGGKAGYK